MSSRPYLRVKHVTQEHRRRAPGVLKCPRELRERRRARKVEPLDVGRSNGVAGGCLGGQISVSKGAVHGHTAEVERYGLRIHVQNGGLFGDPRGTDGDLDPCCPLILADARRVRAIPGAERNRFRARHHSTCGPIAFACGRRKRMHAARREQDPRRSGGGCRDREVAAPHSFPHNYRVPPGPAVTTPELGPRRLRPRSSRAAPPTSRTPREARTAATPS